jgi:hypothetical protein
MTQPRRNDGRPARRDLSLLGISDSELLHIVDDLADDSGWATNLDVRMQLGEDIDDPEVSKRSGVGSRLSWMRRYGWLESDATRASCHRLTPMGHAILDNAQLSRTFEKALAKLNPAQQVRLTREIAQGGMQSPSEIQAALRREWQRNLARRS